MHPKPLLLLICLFWVGFSLSAQPSPHVPGQFLVSLSDGANIEALVQGADGIQGYEKVSNLLNIWLLRTDLPEQTMLAWLRRQPAVRLAQLNHVLENRGIPNDPLFPQQWHFINQGNGGAVFDADMDAEQAWDISTGGLSPAGDTIVIAVIDGGIQNTHPDLAPNLWYNRSEIPNNGIDDDQNGYKDDFRGWNVFAESDVIEGNTTAHGTPVSAILGAKGNNGTGVTGVNWTTKIMFVAASGTEAEVLAAYDYVLQARQKYNNTWGAKGAFVVSVNCSWGINYGQPSEAPLWCEAFDMMGAVGILSVAATANLPINVDETGDLPTACPSNFLISVTNLNSSDEKAASAAWGMNHVDLGAYGQEVYTAAAGNGYGTFSGTSFAAPQVAGAVGLLYSAPCPNLIALAKIDPASAAYWAKSLILENVTPNPSLTGKTATNGRLNLYRTMLNFQGQCSSCPAPFALKTETLTDSSVLLLWSKPTSAIEVNLRWRRIGQGAWVVSTGVADTFYLSDLTECSTYEFEVESVCEKGVVSAWSQPFIFETKGCCVAPASVWLESNTLDAVKIGWEASSNTNSYRLRMRKAGFPGWTMIESDSNTWEFENLESCTKYELQVQARCEDWLTGFSPLFAFQTKGCGACNEVEYCAAKAQDATEEWVASVKIGPWLHNSGSGGNGYQNFSLELPSFPVLTAGFEIPVLVTPGFSGMMTKEYYRIFVDYNQDGDFDDDHELAFDPGFALEGPAEGHIVVPSFNSTGITRLRVMMKFTTPNDNPPTPCTNFSFGQVEDYCVELRVDSVLSSIPVEDTLWAIQAFPQPARDWVVLEIAEGMAQGDCELLVFDCLGRLVVSKTEPILRLGRVYLDTGAWPCGMYSVQARYAGRTMNGKIIKF